MGFKIALFVLIIQMSNSQVQSLHQAINGQLLPKSTEVYQHIKTFLQQEVKSIETINKHNSKLQEDLKEKFGQYSKTLGDLKGKKYKDDRFLEGGAGFLEAKQKEIQAKKKLLQSINTGLKQSVSKVEPKKLALLPYQKKPVYKDLFTTLLVVLFNEPAEKFQWNHFKQKALIFEDGEDFLTRLANINFRDLSENHYDLIRQLKIDPRFAEVSENSEEAVDVVDLADWVDYVCEGHKVHLEKTEIQRVYDKIRKDIAKRSDGSLNLKEEFCLQTRTDLDNYQNTIRVLHAQLQNIVIQMNMSLEELKQVETKRNLRISTINAI